MRPRYGYGSFSHAVGRHRGAGLGGDGFVDFFDRRPDQVLIAAGQLAEVDIEGFTALGEFECDRLRTCLDEVGADRDPFGRGPVAGGEEILGPRAGEGKKSAKGEDEQGLHGAGGWFVNSGFRTPRF